MVHTKEPGVSSPVLLRDISYYISARANPEGRPKIARSVLEIQTL